MTNLNHAVASLQRAVDWIKARSSRAKPRGRFYRWLSVLPAAGLLAGCTASHYRKAADKEVYRVITQKQQVALGRTNSFSIDTPYSHRAPKDISSAEIIQERLMGAKRKVSLSETLQMAREGNRGYQTRKEQLYLTALTLTQARYDFSPKFGAGATATGVRDSGGDISGRVRSQVTADQLLKSGASLGITLANDILHYYTGNPRPAATSLMSVNLLQPLLRGAGYKIVAENLTQAERNAVYEVRSFSHFQHTFAVDTVTSYFRLLQQKDTVRNEYNNFRNLVIARERAEALAVDRGSAFETDQARQQELAAKSRYILAVESYKNRLDQFKITLGLSLDTDLGLDDATLEELTQVGLLPVPLSSAEGYKLAVQHRLDLLNEIDRFEDSKRKIVVAADQLKASLNIFADASIGSEGPTDYTKFDWTKYRADAGVQLNLPLDRLKERNAYRTTLISFERQIRSLGQSLDDVRNAINQDLRTMDQARQNYEIQKNSSELASRRVESATLLLQAGRAQIRDLLEAQSAEIQARNAVTQALIDYHLARLGLMIDVGLLDTDVEKFWAKTQVIPGVKSSDDPAPEGPKPDEIIPPDKLFGSK